MNIEDTRQLAHTVLAITKEITAQIGDSEQRIRHDHDFEAQMEPWSELLGDIAQELERLEGNLIDLQQECQQLEQAGMYPAIPTESWEKREGGKSKYLRMVFPHRTPGMRRKVYIGCKPDAIAEARRLAANRQRWEELDRAKTTLERFLSTMRGELGRIAGRAAQYQVLDGD